MFEELKERRVSVAPVLDNRNGSYGKKDLKVEAAHGRSSLKERQDFEREMDEKLQAGDLDDIKEWITPYNLTKCATNSLEKSLQVNYELRRLSNSKGPDEEDFNALATSVEDFAVQLLKPLESDDMKMDIFEGAEFDRVLDKALQYRQKKFVSHPVVFSILMRSRWTGYFSQQRYSIFKWILLNFWTFFDVLLFPVVYLLLGLIHLVTGVVQKGQDLHVIFLFNPSWKYAKIQYQRMRKISQLIMDRLKSNKNQFATITRGHNGPIVKQFTPFEDAENPTRVKNNNGIIKDDKGLPNCLKKAQELFESTKEGSDKVLVFMTDDKFPTPRNKIVDAVKALKQKKLKVISVGFGVHLQIKELKTMATNDENVFLILDNQRDAKAASNQILKCIKGKDFFDRYVDYFITPYFIFFRDTLSYLALLGLHFAMCLQPSTIQFTAIEWIILVFFLGRFMMETNQVITEKNTEWTEINYENEKQEENNKKTRQWKELRRVLSSYFNDWWNRLDVVTLIVFLILFGLRVFTWSEHTSVSKNRILTVTGYLYGLNTMFLTLRVFGHIMEFKRSTGSIQIALFQIIGAVITIFGQFFAATIAFSLAITKIYMAEVSYNSGSNEISFGLCENRNGLDCWWTATKYLTWSLLGIGDLKSLESSDYTSDLLAKLLYGVFLIMGVMMLMNMMIAILSNTYQNVEDNAFYEWSYKKATTIRTYNKYHPVPVPFNLISLAFKLLRHIYRTINCKECKSSNSRYEITQEGEKEKKDPLFERLIIDLQTRYFALYGHRFPMTDNDKIDLLLKETDGSYQMTGHIAQRVFRYDQIEMQRLESHGPPEWELEGIDVVGQRLVHNECKSEECVCCGGPERHGAKYLHPLSEEYPGFEVLIQETGERRFIAIGVVTREHDIHKYPGWEGNTAGYHIDDGKIFDKQNHKVGKDGGDAMAHRGDLLGCKILYDKHKDNKLPVSFTLNGRVIGEANLTYYAGFSSDSFYPFVGTGCKGISLLFRICPRASFHRPDTEPVYKMLEAMSEQLKIIGQRQADLKRKTDHIETLITSGAQN